MIGIIILCIFIGLLLGFIAGGHYGIDSCSEHILDSVLVEHIKECIFNEKVSNKKKVNFIKSIISEYYGD